MLPFREQPPESDLWIPRPQEGDLWERYTTHTHYFGFCIPEEKIGVFIYVRYLPVINISAGGVCAFQGLENHRPLDCDYIDFYNTLPYPKIEGNVITVENGIKINFLEPGKKVQLTYKSKDGKTSFDVVQTAISPLLPRGYCVPGEETDTKPEQTPGGSEQAMHCVGDFILEGTPYKIDCYPMRDRSWRQVRTEEEVIAPPFGWTPMSFGKDICFNQSSWEAPGTNPIWKGVYKVDETKPTFMFAWIVVEGDVRDIVRVKRDVKRYHPTLFFAVEQEVEAEDVKGNIYYFKGEAIALAQLPSWPNLQIFDSVYKWTDDKGRVTYCTYQEAWWGRFQRFRQGKLKK
jgi:hypothetical protein